jgi:hypothetical protein
MSTILLKLSLLLTLFALGACTASVTYPEYTPYRIQQEQQPPPPVKHTPSEVAGGSSDFYRTQTIGAMIEQSKVARRQREELEALNKYWTEQFQSKPANLQTLTCVNLAEQEKRITELKGIVAKIKVKHEEENKSIPMINRNYVEPGLVKLEQISINYEQWVQKASKSKAAQAERSVDQLAQYTPEYYLHLIPLDNDSFAGSVGFARIEISTSACTEEQLATLTKQIDEYEAQGRSAFAFETECRASTKCVHDRAMNEAMSSLVPGICEDIQNLSFLRGELVRLRSNPSGVVNLYELNKTGDAIQGIQAEMAEQKTEFIKTTGQQFYPALCAKVPQ